MLINDNNKFFKGGSMRLNINDRERIEARYRLESKLISDYLAQEKYRLEELQKNGK